MSLLTKFLFKLFILVVTEIDTICHIKTLQKLGKNFG